MLRYKLFALFTVILFALGIGVIDCAVAGEKAKGHATSITTKWHQIEVGDEEGHIIAVYEAKQVWINEGSDEKRVAISKGIMDMNTKQELVP